MILKNSGVNTDHIKRGLRMINSDSSFAYTEAYKALRTNIGYVLNNDTSGGKTIMITSSAPGDGKSNVSINLAATLAQDNKKVLLVDCDLRKGTLHRYLKISPQIPGIASVLSGEASLEEAIIYFEKLKFSVLTAAEIPSNPSELLGSNNMRRMLSAVVAKFDYVILDTPPVNAVTDTSIISKYVDGAILVVCQNQTLRSNAIAAKEQLENAKTPILGVVLNKYSAKAAGVSSGKDYAYYNYNHYGDSRNSR